MSDSTPDRAWAGRVLFPRSAAELRSTSICPACFTPLTSVVCASCGLDLRHSEAADLASASADIADALDARLDIIGRIRRDTAAAVVSAAAAAPAAAAQPAAAAAQLATPADTVAAPPHASADAVPSAGPRRSGIQISLIIVGISLLSVFAVFGLVYAFVTFGSTVRMAIIVGGTLATMIAAGMLGRRGLTATAEGVATLGTVMLVLDAWALRLNEPDGLGATNETIYWGAALLIVGATTALWSRTSSLAIPAVVGAGLLPIGAALTTGYLVPELLPQLEGTAGVAGGIAGLATAALAWWIVPVTRSAARRGALIVAHSVGAVAAIVALVGVLDLDPPSRYAPVIAGVVLAGAAALHLVTFAPEVRRAGTRRALDTLTLAALGAGAAIAAIVGAVISAARFDQDRLVVSAPLIAATIVAVLAEQAWRRVAADAPVRTSAASATFTAAGLAAIAAGLAAIVGIAAFVEAGTRGLQIIPLDITDAVTSGEPTTIAAIASLALSLGIIALSWATLRVLAHRARVLTLMGGMVAVAAVPLLPAWWLVMLVFALLAVGAAVGLLLANRVTSTDARRALVALCIPLSTGAALGAFVTGWAVPHGWALGLIVALVTIAIARPATALVPLRAGFMGLAAALVLGSMPELAGDLSVALPGLGLSAASTVILAAAVLIASSQVGALAALERQVVGGVATLAAVIAAFLPGAASLDGALTLGLGAVALCLVIVLSRARADRSVERRVARVLLPLVVARAVLLALESAPLSVSPSLAAAASVGALVIVAIVGLVVHHGTDEVSARARTLRSTLSDGALDRAAGDAAAVIASLAVLISGLSRDPDSGLAWLPVLVLAVLILVIATSRDGLIGSRSPRRFIGWVALAIATIALWMRLADTGETTAELYVLPLAGAMLLVVAASSLLARRRSRPGSASAAPLTAAALLVALLPSAALSGLHAATDDQLAVTRAIVVAAVALALAIAPLLAEQRLDAALPRLSSALVLTGVGALIVLAATQTIDLLAASGGESLGRAALVRAVLVVLVLSAVGVAAWMLGEGRLRTIATTGALGSAALGAGVLGLAGAVDPVELVSVPLAIALLAIGTLHLATVDKARSWLWLAPGLVALLAPSLLAIDAVGEPLWRAVAIGVVAAAVFVMGLVRRLQAPFVLGGIALLIHLLVQSWPLLTLVGESVEWWLWLGLAGIIIIVIAARFERRMQNARDLATRISQLR